jgi:hypothetical protein
VYENDQKCYSRTRGDRIFSVSKAPNPAEPEPSAPPGNPKFESRNPKQTQKLNAQAKASFSELRVF